MSRWPNLRRSFLKHSLVALVLSVAPATGISTEIHKTSKAIILGSVIYPSEVCELVGGACVGGGIMPSTVKRFHAFPRLIQPMNATAASCFWMGCCLVLSTLLLFARQRLDRLPPGCRSRNTAPENTAAWYGISAYPRISSANESWAWILHFSETLPPWDVAVMRQAFPGRNQQSDSTTSPPPTVISIRYELYSIE